GVHVFGGFPAGAAFALSSREPLAERTKLTGNEQQPVFSVGSLGDPVVLDGMLLDGRHEGLVGVDQDSVDLDLRAITVRNFAGRGVRLRNSANEPCVVSVCS